MFSNYLLSARPPSSTHSQLLTPTVDPNLSLPTRGNSAPSASLLTSCSSDHNDCQPPWDLFHPSHCLWSVPHPFPSSCPLLPSLIFMAFYYNYSLTCIPKPSCPFMLFWQNLSPGYVWYWTNLHLSTRTGLKRNTWPC